MRYPLHITVLSVALWIALDDANAAKNGFSAEVLTSLAKNVATVLSTTLLGDYQDQLSNNQSSIGVLKSIQETQSSLAVDDVENQGSKVSSSFNRHLRYTREQGSTNEGRRAFQDDYVTSNSKYRNLEAYRPYTVNRDTRDFASDAEETENTDNSINADIDAASLRYSNLYPDSTGPNYETNSVLSPSTSNRYGRFEFQPDYRRLAHRIPGRPEQSSGRSEVNAVANENVQNTRTVRGPYNLNYHAPFHAPYHASFHEHPGFYPHERPIEGHGQSADPADGQGESNPSRLIDDQNQGQSTLGGYDYNPRFHYRPPYHDGFPRGIPDFYYRPRNGSFNPGNAEQDGGNSSGPQFGPPIFPGYRFDPHVHYHQSFYPDFHGHGRPIQPQNPPEQSGNIEETTSPGNGQNGGNGTSVKGPPFGFPPYGPFYGDFRPPGYPLVPFNGFPYHRFGHVFHDRVFPRYKAVPYLNLPVGPYPHFPLGYLYPYFGAYYPHYNGNRPMTMPEKPAQMEKTANENPEAAGPVANSEAEMISESKLNVIHQRN